MDNAGFVAAAEDGDVSKVKEFLKNPKNSAEVEFKRTSDFRVVALHRAAERNRVEVVRTILHYCPSVLLFDEDDWSRTVLHVAAQAGKTEVVRALREQERVNVNAKAKGSITALHLAAFGGHGAVVDQLLSWKEEVDLEACTAENFTALHAAADAGHGDVVRMLLAAYKERGPGGVPGFVNAEDCFKRTPLHYGCRKGHVAVVKELLAVPGIAVGAVDSVYKLMPLHLAAWLGNHAEVVRILLAHDGVQANAEIGRHDYVPVPNVQKTGEVSWKLLPRPRLADREGDDWPKLPKGGTALHLAAQENHLGVVNELLASGKTDVNAVDVDGKTALHYVVERGFSLITGKLAAHPRVDVNCLDRSGKTPLLYAVELGQEREFGALVGEPRVNLNLESNQETALTLAFKLDRKGMVKDLLGQSRLRANTKNWEKKTMLHYLWDKGEELKGDFYEDVKELLSSRGDVQRYLDGLSKDRQLFLNSTNAFLVGAAIVAAVTFAGFLKPPLSGSDTQLAAAVKIFWAFNSVSFFFAIYTLVSGIQSVLPKSHRFVEDEVFRLRLKVGVTSFSLMISSAFVIAAFIAAGFGNLPADTQRTMVASTVFGLLLLVPFIFIPLLIDYNTYLADYSSADVQKLASLSDRLFTSAPFLSILLVTALTFGAVLILIIESVL